ncbi:hypothetical protein BGZ94_006941 [Podila epigama]|nr:hypothetical protein BGZ94_006941 [Podila epigama]
MTSSFDNTSAESATNDPNILTYYKKVNVPLEYPPLPIKEQLNQSKVYPPMMTLSNDLYTATCASNSTQNPQTPCSPTRVSPSSAFSPSSFSSPPSSMPINIPQRRSPRNSSLERAGSMPTMSNLPHHLPSPPTSPWKAGEAKLSRSATMVVDETPYPDLPAEVRAWTSSHVAEYIGYSLRFYPKAVTEDLGRYVRQSACLNGEQFIDLREEDLVRMEINLKWRKMIMKAVSILRRETMRLSRMESLNWEDGFDPEKDSPCSSSASSYHGGDSTPSLSRTSSIRRRSSIATVIAAESTVASIPEETLDTLIPDTTSISHSNDANSTAMTNSSHSTNISEASHAKPALNEQELRQSIVQDLKEILLTWTKEQEENAKKAAEAAEASRSSLGFMEGVVIGGILVAFLLRFSR